MSIVSYKKKTDRLNRRSFLQGTGAALSLPWLECMQSTSYGKTAATPKRLCAVYFPFGVSLPKSDSPHAKWNWFPEGEGKDFKFRESLKSFEPLRDNVTVIGGLCHKGCIKMGGHDTGDTFLTAATLTRGKNNNSISIDQIFAATHGDKTRFPSLTLSSDGGVGEPSRSTTLSFSREGRPIPALNSPAQIYARLFGVETGADAKMARQKLINSGKMLDRVLAHSKQVKSKLGKSDQHKFDAYMESVRSVEERVERAEAWLSIPKPKVDPKTLKLNSSPKGPEEYLQTMFDLMALAFQTDSTRVASYMVGQVAGATSIANAFPAVIGLNGNWHGLAHGAKKNDGPEKLGKFDQYLAEHVSRFVTRLSEMPEANGSVLDNTILLYGSSNSNTHQNTNYPLLLAGGRNMGFKHNQFLKFDPKKNPPMANLFVTMLQRLDVPVERFMDSDGEMNQV